MPEHVLRVGALYPELMNIYADRGNLLLLQKRCQWRGIGFELASVTLTEDLDPDAHDLLYLGGGQDRDQKLCAQDLATAKRASVQAAVERGVVMFGVCGGLQLLGEFYELDGEKLPGLGLVDLRTTRERGPRLICNVAIDVDLDGQSRVLAGFENHGGRTVLGAGAQPLGRVLRGHGNNGRDGSEGVIGGPRENIVGTYLHGPLLPKNAWFADWLIARALGVSETELAPLDDTFERAAHASARRAAGV